MSKVIQFHATPPQLLWAPKPGLNPAWRIHAPAGQLIYMWDKLSVLREEKLQAFANDRRVYFP